MLGSWSSIENFVEIGSSVACRLCCVRYEEYSGYSVVLEAREEKGNGSLEQVFQV